MRSIGVRWLAAATLVIVAVGVTGAVTAPAFASGDEKGARRGDRRGDRAGTAPAFASGDESGNHSGSSGGDHQGGEDREGSHGGGDHEGGGHSGSHGGGEHEDGGHSGSHGGGDHEGGGHSGSHGGGDHGCHECNVDPVSIRAVAPWEWTSLTRYATYGPNGAAFDDANPDVIVNEGGVAVFQRPDVTGAILAKEKAAQPSVMDLLVLITLGPGTVLDKARLTLLDGYGQPKSTATLPAANAVPWATAGFPEGGVLGLQSGDIFKRQLGSVLGAIVHYACGLGPASPAPDSLIALLRWEFLEMTAGALKIDFFGVGPNGILYNSSNSGGAMYVVGTGGSSGGSSGGTSGGGGAVPEPALAGLLFAGVAAVFARAQARARYGRMRSS
jgi:hypothetical protein